MAPDLKPEEAAAIFEAYNVRAPREADANLQSMAGDPNTRRQLAAFLPLLFDSVGRTADPDQALNHWERWLAGGGSRSAMLEYLRSSPRMLDLVCTIFGNSDALAFTLIRDPTLVYWLAEEDVLSKPPRKAGMEKAVRSALGQVNAAELKLDALRRFRRREMLRIGVRDLLRLADVTETTASLSDLASLLIDAAYRIVEADLRSRFGVPMHKTRLGRKVATEFAVIGMGKLGGHELNYSSDVDVLYVCESHEGETKPERPAAKKDRRQSSISNEEYFEMLARQLTKVLTEPTREGNVYRVDLRLRPEGSVGQLTRALDEYVAYYRTRGQGWERLALLKAWPVAGSLMLGKRFVKLVRPFVLASSTGKPDINQCLAVVEDVRSVKDRIDAKMADRGHERRNVKLGVGGIREIEFLVQTIQVLAGKRMPALLDRSTLGSLKRLAARKLISSKERDVLSDAYLFLRDVEHKLQMIHDLQTHALPDEAEELERNAIRMGYEGIDRASALKKFQSDLATHTTMVHKMFTSFFETPKTSPIFKAALRATHTRP
jgi:glutamate-ammonia-ligase adenylyltransferase